MKEPPTINEKYDRLQPHQGASSSQQTTKQLANVLSNKAIQQPFGAGNQFAASDSLLENRWFVLGVIFLAMMFLGLPLLWRCRSFSRLEKAIWTVAVLAYSAAVIWLFVVVMMWSIQQIQQSLL